MKIVVFGTGRFYQENKGKLSGQEIVAFLDNNSKVWGTQYDDRMIHKPEDILSMSYDAIVLMSSYAYEMRKQLMDLGIDKEKIFYLRRFYAFVHEDKMEVYGKEHTDRDSVGIITFDMGYHGGALAAIQLARVIRDNGYAVTFATPEIEKNFLKEMLGEDFRFIVYKNLCYAKYEELEFVKNLKFVIVNTFPMLQTAVNIARYKKVMLWIHETKEIQLSIKKELEHIDNQAFENMDIYAVSKRCKRDFESVYPGIKAKEFPLGICDMEEIVDNNLKTRKVVFALIGAIYPLKSQMIFLKAINDLPENIRRRAEFWIIGATLDLQYAECVKEIAEQCEEIKILGMKTRKEMEVLFPQMDVIVCASTEEMLPTVIMEGMMKQKVCITTNTTGVAEYIEDGVNGYICESQNVEQLSQKMLWIIEHISELDDMRKAARNTYINYFSTEIMKKNIMKVLEI